MTPWRVSVGLALSAECRTVVEYDFDDNDESLL